MRRVHAVAAALVVLASSQVVADELTPLDAGVSIVDGGAPSPERSEQIELQTRVEAIRGAADQQWNLPAVAEHLGIDLGDATQVGAALNRLRQEQATLESDLSDREAIAAALAAVPAKDPPDPNQSRRLERAQHEATIAGLRLDLVEAEVAYLVRTDGARQEAIRTQEAELERRRLELEEAKRVAEETEELARRQQQEAASVADQALGAVHVALSNVRQAQLRVKSQLLEDKRYLTREQDAHQALEAEIRTGLQRLDPGASGDALFERLSTALDEAEAIALERLWHGLLASSTSAEHPSPDLLVSLSELPPKYESKVKELESLWTELNETAGSLEEERTLLDQRLTEHWRRHALALADLRLMLLPRLSPSLHEQVFGYHTRMLSELQAEGAQMAIRVLDHLGKRRAQLTSAPHLFGTLSAALRLTLGSLELVFFIALVWWAMRRWQGWMRKVVSSMSHYVHLGGWPLYFARLADALQTCGPPLLLAAASFSVYHFIGAAAAPAELTVAYLVVFWIALLRGQLRFVDRFVDNVAAIREEVAHQLTDTPVEGDDSAPPAPERPRTPPRDIATRFKSTWRLATWLFAGYVLSRAITVFAIGEGLLHHQLARLAAWLLIPAALMVVHWWRHIIVAAYAVDESTAFSRFLERHGPRRYGALLALMAIPTLLATRGVHLVRDHLAGLDATRRFLAFLFRRQVEQTGQVLAEQQELPDELIALFPTSALSAEDAPLRPESVDEIETLYDAWKQAPTDGSVVVVGAKGMGKSTVLSFLDVEIEDDVHVVGLDEKLTKASGLVSHLRSELGLDVEAGEGEDELVAELRKTFAGSIIAIDNCHNLFLRQVGGFDAWHALSRIVNDSSSDVFWVLTINDVAWDYLLAVGGGVSRFRRIVEISGLSEEGLREVMVRRMRRARFRTSFSDLLVSSVEGMKRSTQIIRTSRGYFSMLWDYTDGNPRLANHFWLRSLVVAGEREARVRLFATPPIDVLEGLPDDAAFALTAIVEHENVNASELAAITNLPRDHARFVLRLCRDRGLLDYDRSTGRYRTSTHWQIAIYRYLKRKNLLY